MGAGKTTVGRQLAKLLRLTFVDLDAEIEARSGADIPWIFDVEGEAGFRKRESAMLVELAEKKATLIATGGGAVLDVNNRAVMRSKGLVIYLAVSASTLYERTLRDTKRPLLQVEDRRAVIDKLVSERDPLYRGVADIIYEGVNNSPSATADELLQLIQSRS
jgi:shikimate kinase